jgi:hypothetical protein
MRHAICWVTNRPLKMPVGVEIVALDLVVKKLEPAKCMVAWYAVNTLEATAAGLVVVLILHKMKLLDK